MTFTLKSTKAPAMILAAGLALTTVMSATVAEAGSAKRVSATIETVVSADAALDRALLAMKNLEDRPGIDIEEYKAGIAEIIETFIATREAEYRKMRSTEVLTAFAQARRPGLWKGRNTDTATIRSDTTRFVDWEVVQVEQRQLRQKGCVSKVVEILQRRSPSGLICARSGDEVKCHRLNWLRECFPAIDFAHLDLA